MLMKAELAKFVAMALVLTVATLLFTDGESGDWRFVAFFLLAYAALTGMQWWWQSRSRTHIG